MHKELQIYPLLFSDKERCERLVAIADAALTERNAWREMAIRAEGILLAEHPDTSDVDDYSADLQVMLTTTRQ